MAPPLLFYQLLLVALVLVCLMMHVWWPDAPKTMRRRRIVAVKHRVVFGTKAAVEEVLAACGWHINTAFVERLNLSLRQRVAAIRRRSATPCKSKDGLCQQLVLFQVYHNFVLPHASLRQPLAEPVPTNGRGSAKVWRPCTPAMAAGLTTMCGRCATCCSFGCHRGPRRRRSKTCRWVMSVVLSG
jgi:hypothetical protein